MVPVYKVCLLRNYIAQFYTLYTYDLCNAHSCISWRYTTVRIVGSHCFIILRYITCESYILKVYAGIYIPFGYFVNIFGWFAQVGHFGVTLDLLAPFVLWAQLQV